jgi:hypothetical protein
VAVTIGAVYKPLLVTVPTVADQMTPLLDVPLALAVNCFVVPEYSVALAGDMETVIRVGLTANARMGQRIKASNEAMRFIGSFDSGNSSVVNRTTSRFRNLIARTKPPVSEQDQLVSWHLRQGRLGCSLPSLHSNLMLPS